LPYSSDIAKPLAPILYVIAGPNSAGKTTFASEYLPHFVNCPEFLNADLIAAGLSPISPESQDIRAGRLLLERMDELTAQRGSFGFENTLSGRTYFTRLGKMKSNGYQLVMFFLWLPSARVAVDRVANRVKQGGHSVAAEDVRRRYADGLRNLFPLYRPLFTKLRLCDATQLPLELIASEKRGRLLLRQENLYRQIRIQAENIGE
jgi:predicted ABC-type ATPase